ncbi:MAG: ATP-dependent Clp protease ATP-binding subunit [Clostridia bacterium]|nr:ATP-dependent Clp protease ATP-binding subunit [Clostridia bacterium]
MLGQIEEDGLPDELKDMMNGGAAPGSGEESDTDEDDFDDKDAESKKSATNTPDFDRMMRDARNMLPNLGALFSRRQNPNASEQNSPKKDENTRVNQNKQNKQNEENKTGDGFDIKKYKFLSNYGIDLNEKARNGALDRVVGRDRETDRVIQILNRRTKNNPALIGEPGVGKTAIAEGLAQRIVRKEVPFGLQNKVVVALDLTALVAGTQFRGQFESRMKGTIDDVKKAGNIILVIDELHNIIGAGEAEGSLNAANILKPALSRGEIQVIGTTTLKEYRKYIEKDGALERRFQPVMVEEPTVADTIEILKGLRKIYEEYHSVRISDSLLEDCVKLSERYISDRFLPDKAIDVFDEACSRANLRNKVPEMIYEKKSEISAVRSEIQKIDAEIADSQSKPAVVRQQDGSDATVVDDAETELYRRRADKTQEIARINSEIEALEANSRVDVTYEDVAKVIETWTGIPVQMISAEEAERLLKLEDELKQHVIGQDRAVSCVARAIRRNRSGFRKRFKPSSFIFAGPTGVGKTELVKQLSILLFGTTESMIRLDMSEYMEKHTVAKLIGAPPGYVGYDEAGQLTEKVRRHPYSVILFDEIEKAHPDVFNMLLQILDDGRLTDSQGRVVNFENTVIILTTNAYGKQNGVSLGFGANDAVGDAQQAAENALKKVFRPEFLNRIDEIVLFDSLSHDSLVAITKLMLGEIGVQCESHGMELEVTDEAVELIVKNGYEEEYGARPLRRYIQKNIEDDLAEKTLKGELEGVKKVIVDARDGKLVITGI